jgi:hypothetical protein
MDTIGSIKGRVVLLPWGRGTAEDFDEVRKKIERMGGNVAYFRAPASGVAHYGKSGDHVTHEFVPRGRQRLTTSPEMPPERPCRTAALVFIGWPMTDYCASI